MLSEPEWILLVPHNVCVLLRGFTLKSSFFASGKQTIGTILNPFVKNSMTNNL
jgi:hypothetical protein